MSAKFLHALADDNPDLSRQIGCMTGIFQMFDRQYLITNGRRLPAPPPPRPLPSGPALSNASSESAERVMCSPQVLLEKNLSKSWKEPQRASLESSNSRSSSSSSFSSLDCNHSTSHDLPPLDRILFPEMPLKNSPKLKLPDHDVSIDIRDVVKDSINRETRGGGLSVKNSGKEGREHKNFYRDSPRPVHLLKKGAGNEFEKSGVLVHLKDASREPPVEVNQLPRLSFDAKDGFSRSLTRDVPRLSYDGREAPSIWSRENNDNNPRLSLDSRDASLLDSNSDSNSNSNSNSITKGERIGIVAKLMGLDAMPKSNSGNQAVEPLKDGKISTPKSYFFDEKMPKIPKIQEKRKTKGYDSGMKPMSSTRFPIEPAPWKQPEKICIPQKMSYRKRENQVREQQVSVYSEIEKRLKDLEFEQSNRDLRALKQILDSMHAKGLLEAEKDVTIPSSNSRSEQHVKSKKESALATDFKSPIVIMKPSKSVLGTVEDATLAPGLPQLRTSDDGNKKKAPVYNQNIKEQTSRASLRAASSKRPENRKTEENFKQKIGSNSSLTSPRLQRKKLEMEKRLKPPIPTSNSNKSSKQHAGRNYTDSTSPRNRARRKQAQTEKNDDMLSDVSTGYNGDEASLRSDSTISRASSKVDIEVTSVDKSGDVKNISSSQIDYQNSKAKSPLDYSNVEITSCEPTSATLEHLSPVSVLDPSLYHEDVSPTSIRAPILSRGKASQVVESRNQVESPEKNRPTKLNKMENIQNLLQKLKQLSLSEEASTDEVAGPAPDHIALLCETPDDPDHRYVSEILLASGLLMKDSLEVQLHASGNPINPDLFLVLEQRKSGWVVKPETRVKTDPQKTHRRLVFDLVNELLLQRLDCKAMGSKSVNRQVSIGGQKLLREICAEIEDLKRENGSSEDESNMLSSKDMMKRSDGWTQFSKEVSGIVLDVERSLFKELIDEVVTSEVMHGPKARANRRRKQLFVK